MSLNPRERLIKGRRKWEGTRDEDSRRARSPWSVVWVCCLQMDNWEHTHSSVFVNSQPFFLSVPPLSLLSFSSSLRELALARPPNDPQQCVRNALNKHWQDSSWERLLARSLTAVFRKRWNSEPDWRTGYWADSRFTASQPSPSCQTKPQGTKIPVIRNENTLRCPITSHHFPCIIKYVYLSEMHAVVIKFLLSSIMLFKQLDKTFCDYNSKNIQIWHNTVEFLNLTGWQALQ